MLRVGLTGGIASGKSTVATMLASRGAHYLSADNLAHELYAPGGEVYDAVIRSFGREILNPDRTINRKLLAGRAFPDRIDELNAVVHPAVVKAQNRWMEEIERTDPKGIALVEAALLLEAGAEKDFDKVIVVVCDLQQKIDRYAQRMGVPLETARSEVSRRSAAQLSDEDKAQRADYIIRNSGSLADTEQQVEAIWQQLQSLART